MMTCIIQQTIDLLFISKYPTFLEGDKYKFLSKLLKGFLSTDHDQSCNPIITHFLTYNVVRFGSTIQHAF